MKDTIEVYVKDMFPGDLLFFVKLPEDDMHLTAVLSLGDRWILLANGKIWRWGSGWSGTFQAVKAVIRSEVNA